MRGLLTLHTGDVTEATGFLAHALAGFEALGERWGMATALSTLGSLRRRSGDLADALAMNERATRYFQELGMQEDTVDSDVQAALMRAQAGDADGARRQLAGLLEEVAQAGWAEPRALVCLGLAQLEWRAGRREPPARTPWPPWTRPPAASRRPRTSPPCCWACSRSWTRRTACPARRCAGSTTRRCTWC